MSFPLQALSRSALLTGSCGASYECSRLLACCARAVLFLISLYCWARYATSKVVRRHYQQTGPFATHNPKSHPVPSFLSGDVAMNSGNRKRKERTKKREIKNRGTNRRNRQKKRGTNKKGEPSFNQQQKTGKKKRLCSRPWCFSWMALRRYFQVDFSKIF